MVPNLFFNLSILSEFDDHSVKGYVQMLSSKMQAKLLGVITDDADDAYPLEAKLDSRDICSSLC